MAFRFRQSTAQISLHLGTGRSRSRQRPRTRRRKYRLPHQLVAEAIEPQLIPELRDYSSVRREVRYGRFSRIDFLPDRAGNGRPAIWKSKTCTSCAEPRLAEFPDCVTERGAKHLRELAAMRTTGARTVLLFIIQIPVQPTASPSPATSTRLTATALGRRASKAVEMLAWRCNVELDGVTVASSPGWLPISAQLILRPRHRRIVVRAARAMAYIARRRAKRPVATP